MFCLLLPSGHNQLHEQQSGHQQTSGDPATRRAGEPVWLAHRQRRLQNQGDERGRVTASPTLFGAAEQQTQPPPSPSSPPQDPIDFLPDHMFHHQRPDDVNKSLHFGEALLLTRRGRGSCTAARHQGASFMLAELILLPCCRPLKGRFIDHGSWSDPVPLTSVHRSAGPGRRRHAAQLHRAGGDHLRGARGHHPVCQTDMCGDAGGTRGGRGQHDGHVSQTGLCPARLGP